RSRRHGLRTRSSGRQSSDRGLRDSRRRPNAICAEGESIRQEGERFSEQTLSVVQKILQRQAVSDLRSFIRGCGISLILGGVLTIIINAFLTPFLPVNQTANVMVTNVFLVRQIASGFAAFFLLLGTIGLHLAQRSRSGWFGSLAFIIAFIGGGL